MAQVIKNVSLEVSKPNIFQALVAKQCDCNSRYINVTLKDDGMVIPINATSTVTINACRPDGQCESFKGTVNADGTALVPIHGWMLETDGVVNCDVSVIDGESHRLTSTTFLINVEKASNADSEISEDENVGILTELITECNAATTAANEALAIASSAFASAIVCESSGEIISLSDAASGALQGLTVYGKTTQDGTPTGSVPVDLVSAGDSGALSVKVAGKNLIPYPYYHTTRTTYGITFTDNGDGTVTANGTSTSTAMFYMCTEGKTLLYLPQGTYSLSGCPQGGSSSTYRLVILTADGSGLYSEYGDGCAVSLSETRSKEGVRVAIRINSGVTLENVVFRPMINFGTTAGTYEQGKMQTLSVTTTDGLAGIPVTENGNYTDTNGQQWICDEVDYARGVYVQRIGKVTFDGTTTLFTDKSSSTNNNAYSWGAKSVYLGADKPALALGTHGVAISYETAETGEVGVMVDTDGTLYCCLGPGSGVASLIEANNNFLALQNTNGTPVSVQYVLAEPIETPLTEEELADYSTVYTNYPNTNVYNNEGAGQFIQYMADTKIYIDNKFNELAAAIINNA